MTRILIVDDEELIGMVLESEFEDAGFDVVGVERRQQDAVGTAHRSNPDVALVDHGLASGDGAQVALALDALGVKVIIATGDLAKVRGVASLVGFWCLPKPFDPAVALLAVRTRLVSTEMPVTLKALGCLVL